MTAQTNTILLVRHGEPVRESRGRISGRGFADYSDAYQRATLVPDSAPPAVLQARINRIQVLVSSALPRAIRSAELLAALGNRTFETDPLFNESRVPVSIPSSLSLPPRYWGILARAAWFLGWSPGVESYPTARRRAGRGASRLEEIAADGGSVALIAHGMINRLIARALRQRGWQGKGSVRDYWSFMEFSK